MRRQRNKAQMKEQMKNTEMETSNLSNGEFKTLVIRMLKELIGYLSSIKRTQAEMKVTLSHRWQTQGPWTESSPPPCFIQPGTLFLFDGSTELSLNC